MQIIPAFVTQNKCYQAGAPLTPRGIMLHSVGTPQPSAAVFARSFNQYQPGGVSVCVHAFAQADGTVYQTLPWEMRGWHCGGSANSTHIGVEMTEPSAGMTRSEAAEQIAGTYRTVVELFAELCKQYELDPAQDASSSGTPRDTGAARQATTQTRSCCGAHMIWATRWTAFGATSPRQWQRKIGRRCWICRAMIPWRRCRNGLAPTRSGSSTAAHCREARTENSTCRRICCAR